jgi:2-C-methyl-D-erythritol 2,4-cyclodiphosphate synthase
VAAKLRQYSLKIVNIDATIIAQEPRMAPYVSRMTGNIASDLDVTPAAINIKATTTEHLGFIGRVEGIAAQAVVLIE